MLDLTALEARFRNLSLFGCKAAGGKVLLFYPGARRTRKKTIHSARMRLTGRSGTGGNKMIIDSLRFALVPDRYLYNHQSTIKKSTICINAGSAEFQ
jgi:hypothetical protein